jgi:hypothetical protein
MMYSKLYNRCAWPTLRRAQANRRAAWPIFDREQPVGTRKSGVWIAPSAPRSLVPSFSLVRWISTGGQARRPPEDARQYVIRIAAPLQDDRICAGGLGHFQAIACGAEGQCACKGPGTKVRSSVDGMNSMEGSAPCASYRQLYRADNAVLFSASALCRVDGKLVRGQCC